MASRNGPVPSTGPLSQTGTRTGSPSRRRIGRTARRAVVAALSLVTAGALVAIQPAAHALTNRDVAAPVTANATWFYALGQPYGGCGMPQVNLETQHFVALNVYDLPGDYSTFYDRPMKAELADKMGLWDNGHNCGRWVQVTVGDFCTGINDGAPKSTFCHDGSWTEDKYNGAVLNMIVADSCGDGNAWCRDDPYHLDLAHDSLNTFVKDGKPVGDMEPDHWGNRHISWKFIPAPDYTGDIQIGFLQSAMKYWPAMAVSRLPNGVHGVEYYQDGQWKSAKMNGDMGQAYIIGGTVDGGSDFQIRIRDVEDKLLNNGRVYRFGFPESCSGNCNGPYTKVDYTTSDNGPVTTPPSGSSVGTCTAAYHANGSWSDGYMAEVAVTAGDKAIEGWVVTWTIPDGQVVKEIWNGTLSVSGTTATVKSTGFSGSVEAGGTKTFGITGAGTSTAPTNLTCAVM